MCPHIAVLLINNGNKDCKKPTHHNFHKMKFNGASSYDKNKCDHNKFDVPAAIKIKPSQDKNIGNNLMDKLYDSGDIIPNNLMDKLYDSGAIIPKNLMGELYDSGDIVSNNPMDKVHDSYEIDSNNLMDKLYDCGDIVPNYLMSKLYDSSDIVANNVNDYKNRPSVYTQKQLEAEAEKQIDQKYEELMLAMNMAMGSMGQK